MAFQTWAMDARPASRDTSIFVLQDILALLMLYFSANDLSGEERSGNDLRLSEDAGICCRR